MDSADLEWLRAVGELGSLSAAAKARDVSVSTASRRLDALEATLGVRLLDRGARGVRLTAEGVRIAALAVPALDALAAIGRTAETMRSADTRQTVRVSATEFVVAEILAPRLADLCAVAPGITIELAGETNNVSLARRQADIAIRLARPIGNSLVARALPPTQLDVFATPTLAAQMAADTESPLPVLTYDDSYGRLPELTWVDALDRPFEIVMRSSSTRALLQAAQCGTGAALLPTSFARRAALVPLAALREPLARTPWITVHRDLQRLPQVRLVIRWIVSAFRAAA